MIEQSYPAIVTSIHALLGGLLVVVFTCYVIEILCRAAKWLGEL